MPINALVAVKGTPMQDNEAPTGEQAWARQAQHTRQCTAGQCKTAWSAAATCLSSGVFWRAPSLVRLYMGIMDDEVMALLLAQPDLVLLCPRPRPHLTPPPGLDVARCVATARIIMPRTVVRLSAGRMNFSFADQALCFLAGANSIFDGDKLLTTPNNDRNEDLAMFEALGLRSRPAFLPYGAGNGSSATDFAAAAAGEAGGCRGDGSCGGGHGHGHGHGHHHHGVETDSHEQGRGEAASAHVGGGCGGRGACGGHQHAAHA